MSEFKIEKNNNNLSVTEWAKEVDICVSDSFNTISICIDKNSELNDFIEYLIEIKNK